MCVGTTTSTGSNPSPGTTSAGRRGHASKRSARRTGRRRRSKATRELAEDLLRRYTGVRQHYGRSYQELPPLRQGCPIAIGRVSLWGRVLARQNGFRAQYAYPYDLFLIGGEDGLARELRRLYAVDVSPS